MLIPSVIAVALTVFGAEPPAPQWPQYRGPNASGLAENASPPTEFSPSRNLRWKTDLPLGHGSPCIWGDRIFVTAFDGAARKLELIALNRGTGMVAWRKAAPTTEFEVVHPISSPATATPVTDGKRIYVYFSSYGVLAFEWDGTLAWEHPMGVAKFNVPDGSGSSPILAAGRIIVTRDGPPHLQMLALDAATGKLVWTTKLEAAKSPGPKVAHATPILYSDGKAGNEQVILNRAGFVSGFALSDGQLLWSLPTTSIGYSTPAISGNLLFVHAVNAILNPSGAVPLPPFSQSLEEFDANHDGKLSADELPAGGLYFQKRAGVPDTTRGAHFTLKAFFFLFDRNRDGALDQAEYEAVKDFGSTAPEPRGLLAIQLTSTPKPSATLAWSEPRNVPDVTAPLVYKGRVYMVTGGGIVSSLDALTGKLVFRGRVNAPGAYFASPVAAGGRVYVTSAEGVVSVLSGGDSLNVLANNDLGEPIYGTPAPVENSLYIRSTHHLWAFTRD
jgi:outer membrane protein assembly factor BamB